MLRLGVFFRAGTLVLALGGPTPWCPLVWRQPGALFPGGLTPVAPPVPLGYGVTPNPQPLSSTTYLRGEEFCLAGRLGQIDVAEAN